MSPARHLLLVGFVALTAPLGCGREVGSDSGEAGTVRDGATLESGMDGTPIVDAGVDSDSGDKGDSGMSSDSCVPIETGTVGPDSGGVNPDANFSCKPDPCGTSQICVSWENQPGSMMNREQYASCIDLPAECALTTCMPSPCPCVANSQRKYGCMPHSCEVEGGAVVVTCYFSAPP
jgi:hypothetical protein